MILFFYLSALRMLFLAKTLQDHQKFHDVRCPKVSDFFDFLLICFEFTVHRGCRGTRELLEISLSVIKQHQEVYNLRLKKHDMLIRKMLYSLIVIPK